MIVYTSIDPRITTPDHVAVTAMWETSWRAYGWEPVKLNAADATSHPYYDAIANSDWLRLTINAWPYMRACYCKWMVMTRVGGLYCDPDILNYGFTPNDLPHVDKNCPAVVLHTGGIPSIMWGTALWYELVVRGFRNAALMRWAGKYCVSDDIGDMNLFADLWQDRTKIIPLCLSYGDPGWETSSLVHYHGGCFPGENKIEMIGRVRPIGPSLTPTIKSNTL